MLEYTLEDAKNLLSKNIEQAKKNLGYVEHDLHFLRYIQLVFNFACVELILLNLCITFQRPVHHY